MAKKFTVQIYCQGISPKTATGNAGPLALYRLTLRISAPNSMYKRRLGRNQLDRSASISASVQFIPPVRRKSSLSLNQPGRHVPLLSNAIEFHRTVTRWLHHVNEPDDEPAALKT